MHSNKNHKSMSKFPKKTFEGKTYDFNHLVPLTYQIPLSAKGDKSALLKVSYSIHCFTEGFEEGVHRDHHRYTHADEMRAFCPVRYDCSLRLPSIVTNLQSVKVYQALKNNYTYVARIALDGESNDYSLFFTLKKVHAAEPTVSMYIQSAYLKSLTVGENAPNWRIGSLLGQITGVFEPKKKKKRPKKKAP